MMLLLHQISFLHLLLLHLLQPQLLLLLLMLLRVGWIVQMDIGLKRTIFEISDNGMTAGSRAEYV